MKTFTRYITEQSKTHLEHLEDFPVLYGKEGFEKTVKLLHDIVDQIDGVADHLTINQKLDGCIHHDTEIITDLGNKTIGEIVDNKLACRVLTKNLTTGREEFSNINNYFINNNDKNWIKIVLDNGHSILVTEDHQIHTNNRGWVEAKDLLDSDDITEKMSMINKLDGIFQFIYYKGFLICNYLKNKLMTLLKITSTATR